MPNRYAAYAALGRCMPKKEWHGMAYSLIRFSMRAYAGRWRADAGMPGWHRRHPGWHGAWHRPWPAMVTADARRWPMPMPSADASQGPVRTPPSRMRTSVSNKASGHPRSERMFRTFVRWGVTARAAPGSGHEPAFLSPEKARVQNQNSNTQKIASPRKYPFVRYKKHHTGKCAHDRL
jgi:hypothetical protein